jgi:hypothetical protein
MVIQLNAFTLDAGISTRDGTYLRAFGREFYLERWPRPDLRGWLRLDRERITHGVRLWALGWSLAVERTPPGR